MLVRLPILLSPMATIRCHQAGAKRRTGTEWLAVFIAICLKRTVLALGCLVSCGLAANAVPLTEIVQTQYGPVRGAASDVLAFKGIPYAAPPVGDLRWRATQPPQHWANVRDATQFGAICPQSAGVLPQVRSGARRPPELPSSEDCLTLNVWTAAKASGEKRPVIVWFHGGGFTVSSGIMDASALARRGAVVVSLNYRLGPLGFLAHPALSQESGHRVSGNYGLLDQLAALHWVQANIAAFGGDPANVTLAGQSAGASSVAIWMISPLADGLFHRAIIESTGTFANLTQWLREDHNGVRSGESDGAARVSDIAAFRKLSAQEVLARLPSAATVVPDKHYYPVIDGYVLPDDPHKLIAAKPRSKIQVLIGHNSEEGAFFAAGLPKTLPVYRDYVHAWLPLEPVDAVLQHYPASTDAEATEAAIRFTGDLRIVATVVEIARALAPFQDVHAYRFSRVSPDVRANWGGAAHTTEIAYVFGDVNDASRFDDTDRKLSDVMASAWVRFAATGDPNGPGLPQWPLYKPQSYQLLNFGDAIDLRSNAKDTAVEFLDKAYRRMRGAPVAGH